MEKTYRIRTVAAASVAAAAGITILTWLAGGRLEGIEHLPDAGAHWYYWQHAEPTAVTRLSAWLGYALHQLTVWYLLYRTRSDKHDSSSAGRYNIAMLVINMIFILLHLIQTHIWYDGLAQDVPIWTSQGSVIVMLVMMLVMLTPRRGFFIGNKISVPASGLKFLNIVHGPFIAWALVYTFWFHPMEGSYGLLTGFFYIFLLFIQMSMSGTKLHFNMKWLVLLESLVAVHGTLITVQKANPIWPMFLSGFLFMFAFTYTFGLTKRRSLRTAVIVLYVIAVAIMYYFRGFDRLYEVTFIPIALYGGGLILIVLLKLFDKVRPGLHNS